MAQEADRYYRELYQQQDEEKRAIEYEKQREKLNRRYQERTHKQDAVRRNACHADEFTAGPLNDKDGLVRRPAVRKRRPSPNMTPVPNPRIERWNRAVQENKEREFQEDQRLQQKYLDYNVRKRWCVYCVSLSLPSRLNLVFHRI